MFSCTPLQSLVTPDPEVARRSQVLSDLLVSVPSKQRLENSSTCSMAEELQGVVRLLSTFVWEIVSTHGGQDRGVCCGKGRRGKGWEERGGEW